MAISCGAAAILTVLLIILAWIISDRSLKNDTIPTHTYGTLHRILIIACFGFLDGDYYFSTNNNLHSPAHVKDIQKIVAKANADSVNIKVLGSGHSRSPIALSEGHYLSLHNYHGLVSIDTGNKLATFRGGSTLSEILSVLDSYNLTLPVLPAIDEQTIGGLLATGNYV